MVDMNIDLDDIDVIIFFNDDVIWVVCLIIVKMVDVVIEGK